MGNGHVYNFSILNSSEKTNVSANVFSKAKAGDSGAFGEIYNLFFQKIYRFVYFRTSHKETAEDLAEEIFLKAYGKIASLRDGDALEGWLYQIARNAIIDYYRQKKATVPIEELENTLEYEANIVDIANTDQNQKLILEALKQMPAEQQIVVKLKFFEQLDNAVIAEMIHKTEGALRVIQHRALKRLQELIDKRINKP